MTIETTTPLLIVAGNFHQFVNYCHDKQIARTPRYPTYVQDRRTLLGRGEGTNIVFIGTWYEREDKDDLVDTALLHRFNVEPKWLTERAAMDE